MGAQFRIKRRIAQVAVTENGQATYDIPRGYDIEGIHLRLAGDVVVTTAGAAVRAEAPTQLIKRVELIADGKNTLVSVPFVMLNKGNVFRKQLGKLTPPSAAAIATYSVEADGMIDFALVDGIRPKDSSLRTYGMSLLQMRFTFGQAEDLFTGAPVGTLTGMYVEISLVECVEERDAKGDFVTKPIALKKVAYQDINVAASNANQEIVLPVGNGMRGVILRAEINGEPSDAVINNIILQSGVDVQFNLPAKVAKRINEHDYELTMPVGFYVADMMKFGPSDVKLADVWDLTRASEAKLVLDVTGGAGYKVTVETIEFIG